MEITMSIGIANAALIAVGLALVATPSSAQENRTFNAWGHEFIVPGSLFAAPTEYGLTHSVASMSRMQRAYAPSPSTVAPTSAPRPQVMRTINVWGARFAVPAE
ncbi:hypothetical protein [Methylobacterium variabile]|jgi:hypothetical protein|uniref:hypothetical protein n=1 Tax=Methylobacterium variabile TaxID=298794 RepID=UPI0012EE49F1|nr:hypothetical protein [Methylobacterium variabile]